MNDLILDVVDVEKGLVIASVPLDVIDSEGGVHGAVYRYFSKNFGRGLANGNYPSGLSTVINEGTRVIDIQVHEACDYCKESGRAVDEILDEFYTKNRGGGFQFNGGSETADLDRLLEILE